jgi:tRNA pseudouridine55 synthase
VLGFLVVDKPPGITSHDVVAVMRAVLGIKKVGHTGTLDPFATGVLPLAVGRATRLIPFLDEKVKVYEGTVTLGRSMDTGDPTGSVLAEAPVPPLNVDHVRAVFDAFRGPMMQTPPPYSAVKLNGKPLYKYAREGIEVSVPAREIRIDSVELIEIRGNEIDIRVQCGPGTYVRVLAEDIGKSLGTCAHLSALRRTASGKFPIQDSIQFEELSMLVAERPDWKPVLRPERGQERVVWRERSVVRDALRDRVLNPIKALGHLPEVGMTDAAYVDLKRTGAVPAAPAGLKVGARWLGVRDGALVAVFERGESKGKIARMVDID